MSSPLFSALAKLDDSLQGVQTQVEWLRAGLEVNDDQLLRNLSDAHQNALIVRDLVHGERPAASWSDRGALEQLMHDLEKEAQIKLNEQRRIKLLDLADELDAGTVKHRFEARANALNGLKVDAIRELRLAAALPDQQKEICGPEASQWLHWACNLLEESDASSFAELRNDFPALEAFTAEMEESYWVPGSGNHDRAQSAIPRARAADTATDWNDWQAPSSPANSEYRKPPHIVRMPSDAAVQSGGAAAAVAVGYDVQASAAASSLAEPHWAAETSTPWQSPAAQEASDDFEVEATPLPLKVCEKCGKTFSNGFHACAVNQATLQVVAQSAAATLTPAAYPSNGKNGGGNGAGAAIAEHLNAVEEVESELPAETIAVETTEAYTADNPRENAETEFHRLRAIVEQRSQESSTVEEEESLGWNLSKKQVVVIVVALCIFVGVGLYAVIHYYSQKSVEAAAAVAAAAAKAPVIPPDADLQKEIEQKLTALKGSTIEVAVQSGVVTLTGKSASDEESVQAEDLTLQAAGVKVVRDRIQVDAKGGTNGKPRAGKPAQH